MPIDFKSFKEADNKTSPSLGGDRSAYRIKEPVNVLTLISYVIFTVSLLITGASYIFISVFENKVEEREQLIAQYEETFKPEIVEDLVSFGNRSVVVNQLLQSRVKITDILEELEKATISNSRVRSINISISKTSNSVDIATDNETDGYENVIQQVKAYDDSAFFANSELSSVNKSGGLREQKVSFNVRKTFSLDLLNNYE